MKIYTRDEIDYFINVLNIDPSVRLNPNNASMIILAYVLKVDITVDEVRKIIGATPHPDPAKGAKYLWEAEE
jgi:hypothetical protein